MDPLLEPTVFNGRKEEVGLTEVAAALQDFYFCEISLTRIFKTFPLMSQMREHYYYSYYEHIYIVCEIRKLCPDCRRGGQQSADTSASFR